MHSADRPYQARRLAGVDQALGDGHAREPAELFDQLRERMDRLAANHPSGGAEPTEPPPEPREQLQIADDPAEVGATSRSAELRPPERIAAERADGVPADVPGHLASNSAEAGPYRPWFAADDGDPWFVS